MRVIALKTDIKEWVVTYRIGIFFSEVEDTKEMQSIMINSKIR